MAKGPRWLPLVLTFGLPLGACGGDRPAAPVATSAAETAAPAPPPAAPPPPQVPSGPNVTVRPDGSASLRGRIGDVAMLRRMPDGSFKRVCAPPDSETRTMLEGMMRARRGDK